MVFGVIVTVVLVGIVAYLTYTLVRDVRCRKKSKNKKKEE